jgi:hypothetical protein
MKPAFSNLLKVQMTAKNGHMAIWTRVSCHLGIEGTKF